MNALQYLHENNIIHRGIDLEHIMIKKYQTLEFVLIDFGFAVSSEQNDFIVD